MKIKTSFVTNSSGSSLSKIRIENKELYNLLKEYIYNCIEYSIII